VCGLHLEGAYLPPLTKAMARGPLSGRMRDAGWHG
jgi:hypothetical protein